MAEKGEFLGEFWLSLHANDNQQTIVKFDNQTYLWSSKGPETSQQSTRNLALCVISMGWEKKEKNTLSRSGNNLPQLIGQSALAGQ